MTIHVQYVSSVIVRIDFEETYNSKTEEELERCLDEQINNTQKNLFYLINLSEMDKKEANDTAERIADILAKRGKIIQNIAFVGQKKIKYKNKDVKDKTEVFTDDFSAQNWLSDQSRHGFLDELSVDSLLDR